MGSIEMTKLPKTRAVGAAGLMLAGIHSIFVVAQPNITVGSNLPELLLVDGAFPEGATITIEEGVEVGVLATGGVLQTDTYNLVVNGTVIGDVVSSQGSYGNAIPNASALTIGATGVLGSVQLDAGSTVVNDGLIESILNQSGTSNLDAIGRWDNSTIGFQPGSLDVVNNGTIRGIGSSAFAVDGVQTIDITNTGVIEVLAPQPGAALNRLSLNAFDLSASESVTITNRGTISAGLDNPDNITAVFNSFSGSLAESGFPQNPVGSFTLINEAGGVIEGQRIFINSLTSNNRDPYDGYELFVNNAGEIRSAGLVFGVRGAAEIVNSGSIIADPSIGAFNFDQSTAVISHFATPGRFTSEALTLTNTETGTLIAPVIVGFTSGVINNAGVMDSTTLDPFGFGGQAIQVGQFFDTAIAADPSLWVESAEINNSGQITGLNQGILVVDGVAELVLNNSGTITGFNAVRNANARLNITNEVGGVLESTGTAAIVSVQNRTEPELNFDDTLVNRGTIIGDVNLGAGDDTVSGNGVFEGSIFLGDGDDTFIAEGGLIVTGSVQGGNGFDRLRIVNGSFTAGAGAIAASFEGFDEAFFEGDFSLAGDNEAAEIALTAPNLVFQPGASFTVDARDDGTGDRLRNAGTISLNGGTVQAVSNDAPWSVSRDYTILTADGGLTGTFDSAISNLPYLDAVLSYTANDVILSLERIDGLIQGDILETTNAQQLSVAARVVPRIVQTQVSGSIAKLFGSVASGGGVVAAPISIATGLSAGDEVTADGGVTGSAWLNVTPTRYDQRAVLPGTVGLQAIDGESLNLMAGVDRVVASRFIIGGFVGYEDSEVDYRAISGLQTSDGYLLGAYAGVALNRWLQSSINVNWALLDNELEEQAFDSPQVQRASYDSERFSVGVDLTASTQRGSAAYLVQAAYNYSDESYDDYLTNRGERVQLENLSLGRFSLTGQISYSGERWNPYLSISYEHDSQVSNTVADENGLVFNAGLRTQSGERLAFDAYIATVTNRSNENQEFVGLNVNYAF
ncbi:MAG: hypothetical protein Cons2KO_00390 [Congregibacter sp.]